MSSYQQLGYQADNLLYDSGLAGFAGAILSPVNYTPEELVAVTGRARFIGEYDVLFDPQLYVPRAQRGTLSQWPYYPTDLDTADLSSEAWWRGITASIVEECDKVRALGICSPAPIPREFSLEYLETLVAIGNHLAKLLENHVRARPLQTAIVGLDYLAVSRERPLQVASVLSKSRCSELYLVLDGNVEPRRELRDAEQLKGAMRLIAALSEAKMRIIVAFSSADTLLWKAAGAAACATGKFFNVRRFTSTRFEEGEAKGGTQFAYWFEESLLAFLRPADVLRLRPSGLLDATIKANQFAKEMIEHPEDPWLGLSWKQYLRWFVDANKRMESGLDLKALLKSAEERWLKLDEEDILMAEPANNGAWIRPWRIALADYKR